MVESVLDKEVHARLIDDIENVAAQARVPVHVIQQSAKGLLPNSVLEWLVEIKKHHLTNKYGLVMVGTSWNPGFQMQVMAAVLLRNFIDARVVTIGECIEDNPPDPTVLLIPDFYVTYEGKPMASWQLQKLNSLLVKRMATCKQTIVYVSDMDAMTKHYGAAVAALLKNSYSGVG